MCVCVYVCMCVCVCVCVCMCVCVYMYDGFVDFNFRRFPLIKDTKIPKYEILQYKIRYMYICTCVHVYTHLAICVTIHVHQQNKWKLLTWIHSIQPINQSIERSTNNPSIRLSDQSIIKTKEGFQQSNGGNMRLLGHN